MLKYIVYNIEERICIMPIIYSILVFILSFVLLLGSYIALVATNKIKKRYKKRVKRSELAETKVSDRNKLSDVLATILIRRGYGDLL